MTEPVFKPVPEGYSAVRAVRVQELGNSLFAGERVLGFVNSDEQCWSSDEEYAKDQWGNKVDGSVRVVERSHVLSVAYAVVATDDESLVSRAQAEAANAKNEVYEAEQVRDAVRAEIEERARAHDIEIKILQDRVTAAETVAAEYKGELDLASASVEEMEEERKQAQARERAVKAAIGRLQWDEIVNAMDKEG